MFWISYASYIVRTSGTNYIYKQYLVTINLQENHIFVQINWLFSQFGRNIKPQKSERETRVKQRERLLFCVNAYLKKGIFFSPNQDFGNFEHQMCDCPALFVNVRFLV